MIYKVISKTKVLFNDRKDHKDLFETLGTDVTYKRSKSRHQLLTTKLENKARFTFYNYYADHKIDILGNTVSFFSWVQIPLSHNFWDSIHLRKFLVFIATRCKFTMIIMPIIARQ